MIEGPEAMRFAKQLEATLCGKQVAACERGNSPHKFAFYTKTAEEYAALLPGKTVGPVTSLGGMIYVPMEPELVLVLGGGGERILFHADESSLPARHQFLLRFTDGACLTVTVQMWGAVQLFHTSEWKKGKNFYGFDMVEAAGPDFTLDYFRGLFAGLPAGCKDSLKFFVISRPGVCGVANGYLSDILWKAGLHPRRRAAELTPPEQERLYIAIREVLGQAVAAGGRDTELDLFGVPGGYHRILDSDSVGQPCPNCAAPLEKIQFQGGASYLCPSCQRV